VLNSAPKRYLPSGGVEPGVEPRDTFWRDTSQGQLTHLLREDRPLTACEPPDNHRCYASVPIDRGLVTLDASKRWRPVVRMGELR
jgi:hypothetical protein